MKSQLTRFAFWPVLILGVVLLATLFNQGRNPSREITYSDFLNQVENDAVKSVEIKDRKILGTFKNEDEFVSFIPADDPDLIPTLRARNVEIEVIDTSDGLLTAILLNWLPILFFIGFWIFMMRQMQGGGNRAMSFGKSRAKLQEDSQKKVTFDDVAGVQEAKEELEEIVEFLKDPHKFEKLGGKIPKGVLLTGPPGTGKTLLARAIAGEADVPFFSISGSDFVEMFVGVGASRVRDLFEKGKKNAPCIIFVDEIDAVGRHRGAGLGGGHDEREQTLNAMLVEMDGFEANTGVIMIAATNRPDVLDPALLRPGRFDRQVIVDYPDVKGRSQILKVHVKKIRVEPGIDLEVLARGTPGFSGADLANMVNEAALLAARENADQVSMKHFENAKEKVIMGPERRSMVISQEEKKMTAYHEAGHVICGVVCENYEPIHKVTIVPRGRALGMAQFLPKEDKRSKTKNYLVDAICVAMGGRVAEELIYGDAEVTTGAAQDINMATDIARKMVCNYGMSERLGLVKLGQEDAQVFLGRDFNQQRNYSDETALNIDREIRTIISGSYERARNILNAHMQTLHTLAAELLEKETLDYKDIMRIVKGEYSEDAEAGDLPAGGPEPAPAK